MQPNKMKRLAVIVVSVAVAAMSWTVAVLAQPETQTASPEQAQGELLLEVPTISAGDGANLVELARQTLLRRIEELHPPVVETQPTSQSRPAPETQPTTEPTSQPAPESQPAPASEPQGAPESAPSPESQPAPVSTPAPDHPAESQPEPETQPQTQPGLRAEVRPADKHAPDPLAHLADKTYTVALTIRKGASPLVRSVRGGGSLAANVKEAALDAMNAPAMAQITSAEALADLAIDLEVLGADKPVKPDALAGRLTVGLTGVKALRDGMAVYILPSEQVLGNMTASEVLAQAMSGLPAGSDKEAPQLSLFGTKHFAAAPRLRGLGMFRGKSLTPPGEIEPDMFRTAAKRVGEYLARNQDQEGCYRVGGQQVLMRDHLLGAYAMAKLSRITWRGPVGASAAKAVSFAMSSVKTTDDWAYLATTDPDEQLGATAMLLLARFRLNNQSAQPVDAKLLAGLRRALSPDGTFRLRIDEPGGKTAGVVDTAMGYAAVWTGIQGKGERDKVLKPVQERCRSAAVVSAREGLWLSWAGLLCDRVIRPIRRDADAPADEVGGFAEPTPGGAPSTTLTGLMLLTGDRFSESGQPAAGSVNRIDKHQPAARAFLYQMIYKPGEAYFTDQPGSWTGGARETPEASRITLEGCAMAIEGLLAN